MDLINTLQGHAQMSYRVAIKLAQIVISAPDIQEPESGAGQHNHFETNPIVGVDVGPVERHFMYVSTKESQRRCGAESTELEH